MRTLLTATLAALLLTALPVASQDAVDLAPIVQDPVGDVGTTFAGQSLQQGGGQSSAWKALDLVALRVAEDPAGFRFEVQVADLGADKAQPDYGNINTLFSFGGADFSVNMYRSPDNGAYFGSLYRRTGDDAYTQVRGLQVERDFATDRVWTTLERFDLLNADGQTPGRGDALTGLVVTSRSNAVVSSTVMGTPGARVGDVMPAGAGPNLAVLFGGAQGEGASLATPVPFRASNGEAATYLYTITAAHDGPAARYRVFVEGVPNGWNATLPGGVLEIPEGGSIEFPLHVTTVFRHQHGTAESFQVHLHEEGGERWAVVDLGVNFLAVPQPAGHHPKLWLHSNDWSEQAEHLNAPLGSTNGFLGMNTLEEDPADHGVSILGMSEVLGVNTGVEPSGTTRYRWFVCLEPALSIGLDFDLSGTGALEVPISSTKPLPGAVLTGRLLHLGAGDPMLYCFPSYYADREATVLAEFASAPADVAPNGRATFSAPIQPVAAADYIAAQQGAGLVLELTLATVGVPMGGNGGARLEPGGWMELPLNEYHDAVQVTVPTSGEPAPGFVAESTPGKDAPGLALPLLAGLLALVALARRR